MVGPVLIIVKAVAFSGTSSTKLEEFDKDPCSEGEGEEYWNP